MKLILIDSTENYYKISREKLETEPGFEKFPKADKLWVWFQLIT